MERSKMKLSKTKWEKSLFGGYQKILSDYPFIRIPWKIKWKIPQTVQENEENDLSYHQSRILIEIFLLRVNIYDLKDEFLENSTIGEDEFTKTPILIIDNNSKNACLWDIISNHEDELKNLFNKYKFIISQTIFWIDVSTDNYSYDGKNNKDKNENKDKNKKGKQKQQKQKENEDNKESNKSIKNNEILKIGLRNSYIEKALEHLSKVSKVVYENYNYSFSTSVSGDLKKKAIYIPMTESTEKYRFSPTEITYAQHLVRLLDISFDPRKGKVNDLRTGTLDTNKIATALSLNPHIYYRIEEKQITRPFSVCMLLDESGSMRFKKHYAVKLLNTLYLAFSEILSPEELFIYGHTGGYFPKIYIYQDRYNPNYENTIVNTSDSYAESNYDGPAIESIHEKVRQQTSNDILFIVISDGYPAGENYGGEPAINDLRRVIEKAKRDRFVTMGVGVEFNEIKAIYHYHTFVMQMQDLARNVSRLVNHVVKTEFC